MERTPKRIAVNGNFDADWSLKVWKLWHAATKDSFKPDQWVSSANYYTPRPYRNEYDRGSDKEGFLFVIQPGQHVCFWERVDNRKRNG